MNNLIRAELLKLRTTRTFWWSVVAALTFVPLSIALAIAKIGTPDGTSLDSVEGFRNVIAAASSGGMLVLLIGIMVMAGEFRFNTITSTFLITPERKRVVAAKLAASSLVGIAIAVVSSSLTLAIALPWLASRHVDVASHSTDIVIVLLGGIAATAISRNGWRRRRLVGDQPDPRRRRHAHLAPARRGNGRYFAPGLGRWPRRRRRRNERCRDLQQPPPCGGRRAPLRRLRPRLRCRR